MSGDDGKDFWGKLGNQLGGAFGKGREQLVRSARVGRLAIDERGLEHDRQALFADIGRLAVEALRAGRIADEAMSAQLKKIEAIEARIQALRDEREGLREEGLAENEESVHDASPPPDTPASGEDPEAQAQPSEEAPGPDEASASDEPTPEPASSEEPANEAKSS